MNTRESARRHRSAFGALLGMAVGESLARPFADSPPGSFSQRFPGPVVGGTGELDGSWGPLTERALAQAEAVRRGRPVDIDIDATTAVAVAVALAGADQGTPLLVDGDAAAMCDHLCSLLAGRTDVAALPDFSDEVANEATTLLRTRGSEGPETAPGHRGFEPTTPTRGSEEPETAPKHRRFEPTSPTPTRGSEEPETALGHRGFEPTTPTRGSEEPETAPKHRGFEPTTPTRGSEGPETARGHRGFEPTTPTRGSEGPETAPKHRGFEGVVGRAIDLGGDVTRRAAIAGALVGAADGPAVVPARWATYVHGPVGGNTYRLRQVRRLAERLLGWDLPEAPEPRRRVGPVEVLPKLWLSNLPAATRFTAAHPEGAVISLCPTRGTLDGHPVRREFALADTSGPDDNPQLAAVLDEILAAVDAFHDEGRPVLVHCHHGASRTGLVLRAWLMRAHDIGEDDATTEAIALWSKTSTHNRAFTRELRARE